MLINREIVRTLRGIIFFILANFRFARLGGLEIINRKSEVSKSIISVFIFLIFLTGFAQETHNLEIIWMIPCNRELVAFGFNLAHGDINNDGYADIVISADTAVPSLGYCGRAYLYYGGNGIGDTIPDVVFKSPFVKGAPPTRVHCANINGDNFDDIIIGEDQANEGFGGVTIFFGGNSIDTVPDIILQGSVTRRDGFFGCAVGSGDVNGDSYKDLFVGALGAQPRPGARLWGRVFIYYGGPNFDTIPDVILNGGHENDSESFGSSVSGRGDVNNDGFDDIIIGAQTFGPGVQGRIYIYFGGNPMDTIYDVAMMGDGSWNWLGGHGVDFIRNYSTFDYAITSAPNWNNNHGKIYVLFGGEPMDSIPDVWMVGKDSSSWLGVWTTAAGDLNSDLSDDIISGAPTDYDRRGSAYIWLGGTALDIIPDAWIRGTENDSGIGWHVASAGDVDEDGKDEIMVSNYASAYTQRKVWICKYTGPGIEENRLPQTAYRLPLEIKPNPTKSQTAIRFSLAAKSKISLKVYNIAGNLVKTLNAGRNLRRSGKYEVKWDLRDNNQKRVANGIYFIEIKTENKVSEIKKITVVK